MHIPAVFPNHEQESLHTLNENDNVTNNDSIEYLKEKDIVMMQLVADGFTALEIGDEMGLKKKTVEHRIFRLRRKMKSRSITHLAILLLRAQVIK